MQTIEDLANFMTENCYLEYTLNSDGKEIQLANGLGLKYEDEIYQIRYHERGNIENIQNFKTESDAVEFFYKKIKYDKLLRRHCIGIFKSKESSTELTEVLKNRKIRFEQDSILYAVNETRFRVFVFGCDIKAANNLKDIVTQNEIPWTDNKTLLEYSQYTPCKDIFQAVCDEIGKHYTKKGYKYFRARPKIIIEKGNIKLEISFSSSRSNIPGQSVNLEILPNFYSKQLKNSKTKGLLFGHTGIFYNKYKDDVTKIRVNQIFGEVLERTDEYSSESKIIDSNNCNIYGLEKEEFNTILNFIDNKIIIWLDKIQTMEGLLELITNASPTRIWSLNGKGSNSEFIDYVKINYPELDIKSLLEI